MKVSVIIPAHNEEKYIEDCLISVKKAEKEFSQPVEIVVSLNRCTDKTEDIARRYGAIIAKEDAKNISKIRNAGVHASSGEIIITIDSDSRMSPNMLSEVQRLIKCGRYVGGGTIIKPERISVGIMASLMVIFYYALRFGLRSAGLFWCLRKDFDAVGGFNEELISLEDLDFANRLAEYGNRNGLKYGTILRAHIVTSCRKFDKYGDWYFFKHPNFVKDLFKGTDQKSAGEFFYNPKR